MFTDSLVPSTTPGLEDFVSARDIVPAGPAARIIRLA